MEARKSEFGSTEDILSWVDEANRSTAVEIRKTTLSSGSFWHYDRFSGRIENARKSFFSITGIRRGGIEHPVMIQDEIGFLGLICREFGGTAHFLVQAKIEPGNVNHVQISPTIQATKSNFTRAHGGKAPAYLDYFTETGRHTVVADQLQSEQSSRFLRKRNRNIIIEAAEDVTVLPTHMWATLGQLKELMKRDNLVNMDLRTVISCLPRFGPGTGGTGEIPEIYGYINDYKMFGYTPPSAVPLHMLDGWRMEDSGIYPEKPYPFQVIYCDISIEGREVTRWSQPLFESRGKALFGLFICRSEGETLFLVRAKAEIGCFDGMELGPTVQREATEQDAPDGIEALFVKMRREGRGVLHDVVLSEEGGRFYREQNMNVIIETDKSLTEPVPPGYFWVGRGTLHELVRINNCLNIQLRNLLALLED